MICKEFDARIRDIHKVAARSRDERDQEQAQRRKEEAETIQEFRYALFTEYLRGEVLDNLSAPARELIWYRAWSEGHSAGLQDVESVFADLADLVIAVVIPIINNQKA